PRGITNLGTRSGRARKERRRDVDAVAGRGAANALLLIVRFLAGETAASVEQFAIELLLPFERAPVQSSRFELARQLASCLGQRARRTGFAFGLQALELLRERALASGKLAHPLHDGLAAEPHPRQ